MSIAAQTASALIRAGIVAGEAVALSGWLSRALAAFRGRLCPVGWALLLAPFLTPPLLVSYAYSRIALALVVTPWSHHFLYATLLFLKLAPVATVVRWIIPSALSGEALHVHGMLASRSFVERAKFSMRGAWPGAWFAGGIVFLLAFADFEMASLWSLKTWTVAIFDAQTGGMSFAETLRLAALPVSVQIVVLALLLSRPSRVPMRSAARPGCRSRFAVVYLVLAALVVCGVPLIVVSVQAVAGLPSIVENFVLGNEIVASMLFALGAAALAAGLLRGAHASRVLVSSSRQNEHPTTSESGDASVFASGRKVREGGTPSPALGTSALPGVPGLLGPLIVALLVLALFQIPLLRPAYDTPLPLLLALTIILLPLALLLSALLQKGHASPMRHIACQLGSRRLLYDLESQPRLAAFALLFCWAYFDFTASSLLAPTRFTPVFVRLHNLAHYGQTAVLSAMMLAAFAAPAALLLLTSVAGRIYAHRDGR